MTTRIEVYIREDLVDAAGEGLLKDIEDLNIKGAKEARFIRVTELEGGVSKPDARRIGKELLSDPVSQKFVIGRAAGDFTKNAWIIEIRYNQGVTDFVAESTLKGIADMRIKGVASAKTSTKVILRGGLSKANVENISRKLLANPVIQTYKIEKS